ncbi:MAG: glycosyltransferase, partial [Dehalococcoidia bacterium]|nr:glycosyltransferase [Dehalococcoidia bacterium]
MVVKNEAPRIRTTLESARGTVDSWVVLDTGSTDGTVGIVDQFLCENGGGPGLFIVDKFAGYAPARNHAFKLHEENPNPACWTLTLSSDETLHGGDALRSFLASYTGPETAFNVELHTEGATCLSARVRHTGSDWWYEGAVHEQLVDRVAQRDATSLPTIPGVYIEHHATDPERRLRRMRDFDVPALTREIDDPATEPARRAQSVALLAQTYDALAAAGGERSAHDAVLALGYYGWRAEMGGDEGQVEFARLHFLDVANRIGLYEWEEMNRRLGGFLAKYPRRPEAHLMLAAHTARRNVSAAMDSAMAAAQVAADVKGKPAQGMPVDPSCEWKAWQLVAECARALGDVGRMREA